MNKLSYFLVSSFVLGGLTLTSLDNNIVHAEEILDNTDIETIIPNEIESEDGIEIEEGTEIEDGTEVLIDSYEVPENLQEEELQQNIEEIMETKMPTSSDEQISVFAVPQYSKYEYVKGATTVVYASGYAGNQPTGGTRFKTGGGFYWSSSGGPSTSVSFSIGAYGGSVGISFGTVSSSNGTFVNVPNKTNYFKLKVKEGKKITKTAVYGYPLNGGSKKFLYYIYPSSLYNRDVYAVKIS